jgi:hypothetical protein
MDNIEVVAVSFSAHIREHDRVSAERLKVVDESKPRRVVVD